MSPAALRSIFSNTNPATKLYSNIAFWYPQYGRLREGYRRDQEIRRPKLDAYTGIIDQILEADKLVPKKQRHPSQRT